MARRVMIVETGHSGHLMVFVRVIADAALASGDEIVIAIPEDACRTVEFSANLSHLTSRVVLLPTGDVIKGIEELAGRNQAEVVVVPNGDPLVSSVALRGYRGPGRLSILIMRDPDLEAPENVQRRLRQALKRMALWVVARRRRVEMHWLQPLGYTGARLHVVDPFIADGTCDEIRAGAKRLRAEAKMEEEVFWFVVTGAVTERKNLPTILDAMTRLAATDSVPPVGLAVIGPLRAGASVTERAIRDAGERGGFDVVVEDRMLTNLEMNEVVAAADSIVMAYSTPNPNSTLVKARALGTRLVMAGPAPLRAFARSVGFERVCILDAEALAEAMRAALSDASPVPAPTIASPDEFAARLLLRYPPND